MSKLAWWIAGTALLLLAPAPKLEAAQGENGLAKKVDRALAQAGLSVGPEDVGCTHPIQCFQFTGTDALVNALNPIRARLKTTYDNVHMGVRVVLGPPGAPGSVPSLGTAPLGGPGGGITLAIGNNVMLIAIGGDGGDGAKGAVDHHPPKIIVPGAYNGGHGGRGGTVNITAGDHNCVFALGGDGGNGGAQGALAGRRLGPPGPIIGNAGDGALGGAAELFFGRCNSMTAQGGDGGNAGAAGGFGDPPRAAVGGDGGRAVASSDTPPNVGTIEGGFRGTPNASNGGAIRIGLGTANIVTNPPQPGP